MTQATLFDPSPRPEPRPTALALPAGALPAHVRQRLTDAGHLDADGFGRAARLTRCPRCRAETIRGLDGDICAISAVADAIEVDALGEALAIAVGRMRWWLERATNSKKQPQWQLFPRHLSHIGKKSRGPIVIEHRCNAPPPPAAPENRFILPEHTMRLDFPDDPPF